MGSPPQSETMGAPQSSTAFRHSSTVNISLIVDLYSRMRPQPVHVRLQACSGSSIITSGNFSAPLIFLPVRYPAMLVVKLKGPLIRCPPVSSDWLLERRRGTLHTAKVSAAIAHVVVTRQGVKREGVSI